jgi:hypothetical protein
VILRFEPVGSLNNVARSTNLSNKELIENQVKVKDLLKNANLTKVQAAGVMGNIQKESYFNPKAINQKDSNSYPSVGLIQWNGVNWNPRIIDPKVIFNLIGETVEEQVKYIFDGVLKIRMNNYRKITATETDPYQAAFQFAKIVEVCADCSDFSVYNNKTTNEYIVYQRSEFAVDFFNRFNDSSDTLYWGNT